VHATDARIGSGPARRNVLSGSYNNYFHIYDTDATQDIVLQADKSAFKAKKIGGKNNKGGAGAGGAGGAAGAGGKGAAGAGAKKPIVDTENIDYNKKILHASWHPREDTIAIAATNNLFLFSKPGQSSASTPSSSGGTTQGSGPP
ncbi:hypothetical protein JCM8202_003792, partial [Rhodotorula sphaerocarpa]